jgi:hypothetical protein
VRIITLSCLCSSNVHCCDVSHTVSDCDLMGLQLSSEIRLAFTGVASKLATGPGSMQDQLFVQSSLCRNSMQYHNVKLSEVATSCYWPGIGYTPPAGRWQ